MDRRCEDLLIDCRPGQARGADLFDWLDCRKVLFRIRSNLHYLYDGVSTQIYSTVRNSTHRILQEAARQWFAFCAVILIGTLNTLYLCYSRISWRRKVVLVLVPSGFSFCMWKNNKEHCVMQTLVVSRRVGQKAPCDWRLKKKRTRIRAFGLVSADFCVTTTSPLLRVARFHTYHYQNDGLPCHITVFERPLPASYIPSSMSRRRKPCWPRQ